MKKNVWKFGMMLLAACLLGFACTPEAKSTVEIDEEDPVIPGETFNGTVMNINPGTEYQTMMGFGASDSWDCQIVGRTWQDKYRDQIAEWLFSQDFDDDGQPKGIGLSNWRINLGAGSWEQGDASKIGMSGEYESRLNGWWIARAESYLADVANPYDATSNPISGSTNVEKMTSGIVYDWAKRQGHYYWMKKAKEMGCEFFTGFHNSPLVCWTLSGTANTAAPGSTLNPSNGRWTPTVGNMQGNLQTDKYGDYAAYLADVLEHFATDTFNDKYGRPASMRFNYISPLNEPQYDWNEIRQEGTPWSNENIAKLTREINSAIMDASRPNINDTNTKIMIPESGHWDHAYASAGSGHYANNQLENFFDKTYQGGTNYVGDLPTMKPNFLAGHTYWTHDNDTQMINHRKNLATVAERLGVAIWNTEWSVLTNGTGLAFYNGSTHWECAIFMGKLIHTDLTVANMQSWSFWTSVDQEWGNTNYYSLVGVSPGSIDKFDPMSTEFLETGYGNVKSQSTLWVLGHWSLFVRPGFVRIDISGSSTATARNIVAGNLQGLMASAYKSPPGFKDVNGEDVDRIVVVYVNNGRASREVKAEFKDGREPKLVRCFYTNESNTNSLENEGKQGMRNRTHLNGVYIIPAKSVLTAVYDF